MSDLQKHRFSHYRTTDFELKRNISFRMEIIKKRCYAVQNAFFFLIKIAIAPIRIWAVPFLLLLKHLLSSCMLTWSTPHLSTEVNSKHTTHSALQRELKVLWEEPADTCKQNFCQWRFTNAFTSVKTILCIKHWPLQNRLQNPNWLLHLFARCVV